MDKEILKLLKESRREFNKNDERVEVLKRNKKFMKERSIISKQLGSDFFRESKRVFQYANSNLDWPSDTNKYWVEHYHRWRNFCDRWDIDSRWNGQRSTLKRFIKNPVEITFHKRPKSVSKGFLSIKIDARTILEDIRTIWPRIERYQKIWLSMKIEKKTNFGRDICWYDLHKKYKLSIRQIANLWIEKYPDSLNIIIIRRLKKNRILMNEIKESIENNEELKKMRLQDLDDRELHYEITQGKLARKFKSNFDDERKFYIDGITEYGKIASPFLAMIKQSIKRMQKNIDQIEVKHTPDIYDEILDKISLV